MACQAIKWHGRTLMHIASERSQYKKVRYCMIPTIWHSGKGNYGDSLKKKKKKSNGCCAW